MHFGEAGNFWPIYQRATSLKTNMQRLMRYGLVLPLFSLLLAFLLNSAQSCANAGMFSHREGSILLHLLRAGEL